MRYISYDEWQVFSYRSAIRCVVMMRQCSRQTARLILAKIRRDSSEFMGRMAGSDWRMAYRSDRKYVLLADWPDSSQPHLYANLYDCLLED